MPSWSNKRQLKHSRDQVRVYWQGLNAEAAVAEFISTKTEKMVDEGRL